ncbi:hypothetical protein BN903_48 [Halorubrum sp. AJ67]|nr:hypothetical protein BN903_48 [Halorubrum sp. AJ67]
MLCVPASAASGSTEVAARAAKRAGPSSGGAGLEGAAARTKTRDARTAGSERSERLRTVVRESEALSSSRDASGVSNDSERIESSRLGLRRSQS